MRQTTNAFVITIELACALSLFACTTQPVPANFDGAPKSSTADLNPCPSDGQYNVGQPCSEPGLCCRYFETAIQCIGGHFTPSCTPECMDPLHCDMAQPPDFSAPTSVDLSTLPPPDLNPCPGNGEFYSGQSCTPQQQGLCCHYFESALRCDNGQFIPSCIAGCMGICDMVTPLDFSHPTTD